MKDRGFLELKGITSNYYETEPARLVKEPSSTLFYFTEITLIGMIRSIRPDGYFLFANLKNLRLIHLDKYSTKQIAHTIDQFEQVNVNNKKLDSIELKRITSDKANLELLSNYRIQKLSIDDRWTRRTQLDKFKLCFNHLKDIEFVFIDLRTLDETTFDCCASTLEKLSIMSGYPEHLYSSALFNKLINLKELKLSNGKIQYNGDFFKNPTKLTKLALDSLIVEKFKENCFESFTNLKSLELSVGKLKQISPGSFNGLSSLTCLILQASFLTALEEGAFQGLTNLEELRVICFSDALKSIGARAFSGLSKLKSLDLRGCGIEFIDQDAFDDSQEIAFLNLSFNKLKKFVTKCSPKRTDLTNNKQIELVEFIGSDLSNIEQVNLDQNETLLNDFNSMFQNKDQINIRNMTVTFEALGPDASFSHMNTLKELTVQKQTRDQPIRISCSAFHGLTNLESLKLKFLQVNDSFYNHSG